MITTVGAFYTTGDNQFSGWTKKKLKTTFQSQTCTQKRSWSLFWSAALLIHYSFLNPGETVRFEKYAQWIDEMYWKLQCPQLALVGRMGPILHDNTWLHVAQPAHQKLNELGYEALPHPPYSPDLSPTDYHFFKHLDNVLQGKCFHNQQKAENAFQEFIESWSTDFYAIRINKLILPLQKCVDCNGSYFD